MAGKVRLTAAIQETIVAYIRAGGYPHVAAEAAGVPREEFERWLELGEWSGAKNSNNQRNKQSNKRYRALAEAVRQAQAQARLGAEVTAHNERPLDWLRNGPGKPAPGQAGWTATARPAPVEVVVASSATLIHAEIQTLVTALLRVLEPYPEARIAVAEMLAEESSTSLAPLSLEGKRGVN